MLYHGSITRCKTKELMAKVCSKSYIPECSRSEDPILIKQDPIASKPMKNTPHL